jgi:homoserine kinase
MSPKLNFRRQKVARLLHLAGATLAAVHPDNISPATFGLPDEPGTAKEDDTENVFKERAAEYFGTLNVP